MNRASFFRSLLVGAGGLIVGDEALESFARLTHVRTTFPSAGLSRPLDVTHSVFYHGQVSPQTLAEVYRKVQTPLMDAYTYNVPEYAWLAPNVTAARRKGVLFSTSLARM